MQFNDPLFNANLFNGGDLTAFSSLEPAGFHAALATWLYPQALQRERRVLFGEFSLCTLYSVSHESGEAEIVTLADSWMARRIPTIESGALEQWRLEIVAKELDWPMILNAATVRIVSGTGELQRYRVMQVENAMKPGHVYHLRLEAIDQT